MRQFGPGVPTQMCEWVSSVRYYVHSYIVECWRWKCGTHFVSQRSSKGCKSKDAGKTQRERERRCPNRTNDLVTPKASRTCNGAAFECLYGGILMEHHGGFSTRFGDTQYPRSASTSIQSFNENWYDEPSIAMPASRSNSNHWTDLEDITERQSLQCISHRTWNTLKVQIFSQPKKNNLSPTNGAPKLDRLVV